MPLSTPAREVVLSVAGFYRVRELDVLRVILESVLDAASEDGALQMELAAAARHLRRRGHVPGCWLDLEGDSAELEADEPAEDDWFKAELGRAWQRLVAVP